MLVYDDVDSARHIQLFDKGVEREFQSSVDSFAAFRTRLRAGDLVVPNTRLVEPLAVEIDHFVSCVLDTAAPVTGPRHGLEVTAVLEALDRSMRDGGASVPVEYPEPDE
jgi:predicted dehydrogenase